MEGKTIKLTGIFRKSDNVFNILLGKQLDIPITFEEVLMELVDKGFITYLDARTLTIQDLEIMLEPSVKSDIDEVKNYTAYIKWKIKWEKIMNSLVAMAPPKTKREIDLLPHIIIEQQWVEQIMDHVVKEVDDED